MRLAVSGFSSGASALSHTLARWFPTPALIAPRAAGIDISDSSIKWLVLTPDGGRYRVQGCGEVPLAEGVVKNGVVQDVDALGQSLRELKKARGGVECAHVALPEEAAYVYILPRRGPF